MNYKQLIADSWHYTQNNKKIIFWLGFLPSLFTTTVGVGYMVYQFFAFKTSFLFSDEDHSFLYDVVEVLWTFAQDHLSWTLPIIIFAIIFGLFYMLFPTMAKAAAIQTIARSKNGQKSGVSTGFRYGIMSFLKLFEYHLLIKTFAFFSILLEMSFVIRNLGVGIFKILLPIFLLFMVIGFVLTLLFTYSDFFIVIDDDGVFNAMKKSAKLVVMHWKYTFLITILMIIIGVRIFIQAVLVFLIPSLIILITGYFVTIALQGVGIIVGGIVGIIALVLSAYLSGIVDVFAYSVWTHTFLELSSEKELSAREVFVDDIGDGGQNYSDHKNLG